MAGNSNLNDSARNKQDEFYTQLSLIESELKHYRQHFKGKTVLCNCDDPYESNFFKYFAMNFNALGLSCLLYTSGITMFEMITGVLPFQGNNSVSIALMHINDELPDIRQYNPNCTRSLEGIIRKATMKKADERYASIDLLLADLIRARAELNGSAKEEKPAEKKACLLYTSWSSVESSWNERHWKMPQK